MVFNLEEVIVAPIDPKTLEILRLFDFSKNTTENIAALVEKFDREKLQEAVSYIKANYKDTHPIIIQKITKRKSRTKEGYATDIKIFIRGLQTSICQLCDSEYCHTAAENTKDNNINCLICNRYSHASCSKEMVISEGLYFVCTDCAESMKNRKTQTENNADTTQEFNISKISRHSSVSSEHYTHSNDDHHPSAPPPEHLVPDPSQMDKDIEEAREKSKGEICPLYMEAKCPHGLRGVNCEFEHPKRCNNYCRFGTDKYRGCRRGRKCWFYHPTLCQNSLKIKVCLNLKCTLTHLVGTRRKNPRNDEFQMQNKEQPETSYRNNNSSNRSTPQPWSTQCHNEEPETDQKKDFLSFLEKLKSDLQTTMQTEIAQQVKEGIQQIMIPMQQQIVNPQQLQVYHNQQFRR